MTSAAAPVIGLTVFPRLPADDPGQVVDGVDRRYLTAVEGAGGVPVLIPAVRLRHVPALLELVDGLVLTGGGDIEPWRYGQAERAKVHDPRSDRDAAELELVRLAGARHLPVLGICRGMQCLCVATGGTLLQDLGDRHGEHPSDDLGFACHDIEILPATHLQALLPHGRAQVNSQHHQALDALPPDFRVAATGPGGVVEAIESTNGWWALGVQWHPEALPGSFETGLLFRELVARAAAVRDSRSAVGR